MWRTECRARVPSAFTENADEQIRRAVENLRRIAPARRTGHVPFNPHETREPVEAAQRRFDLRQHVQSSQTRRGVTLLLRQFRTHAANVTCDAVLDRQLR